MNVNNILKQYEAHTLNVRDAHVKRIGNNIADVFVGEGFGQPTRMRLMRGKWTIISGPKLDAAVQLAVITSLS